MWFEGQEQLSLLEALQLAAYGGLQANSAYSYMYVIYLHIQFYKLFQRGISRMLLSNFPTLQDEELVFTKLHLI